MFPYASVKAKYKIILKADTDVRVHLNFFKQEMKKIFNKLSVIFTIMHFFRKCFSYKF